MNHYAGDCARIFAEPDVCVGLAAAIDEARALQNAQSRATLLTVQFVAA